MGSCQDTIGNAGGTAECRAAAGRTGTTIAGDTGAVGGNDAGNTGDGGVVPGMDCSPAPGSVAGAHVAAAGAVAGSIGAGDDAVGSVAACKTADGCKTLPSAEISETSFSGQAACGEGAGVCKRERGVLGCVASPGVKARTRRAASRPAASSRKESQEDDLLIALLRGTASRLGRAVPRSRNSDSSCFSVS
mmetsp:Transcript_97204/g.182783  ORF Transcript_97204/g.182783 Transcript_97204/m.182783 type:complete len:191 (+) Transcript_97204:605-1177(+)